MDPITMFLTREGCLGAALDQEEREQQNKKTRESHKWVMAELGVPAHELNEKEMQERLLLSQPAN